MATLGTYYLNAPSLSSATSVYTDAALTIVGPDGWYSDGLTVRQLVVGVFTDIVSSCAPCASPCSTTPIFINGFLKSTMYFSKNLNNTSLDVGAVVIEITQNMPPGSNPPFGFYIEYDGVQYNTVSSQNYGLLQGVVGVDQPIYIGETGADCGIVAAGAQSVSIYQYNPVTTAFDDTGQSEIVQALAPQLQLTVANQGKCVMVIPKPNASVGTLSFRGLNLCSANRDVQITVNCPQNLPSFTSTIDFPAVGGTCTSPTNKVYYSADVNGTTAAGGFFGLFDWVFLDPYGQTTLPDGWYRSPSVPFSDTSFETLNGVIIGFGACGAVTGYDIDYEVENAISGSCSANVSALDLEITQPPLSILGPVSAPSSGTQSGVPTGLNHAQLVMTWSGTPTPCGQVKMVIEKDGVIIAFKTLTPTAAGVYYLDVDFNLIANSDIYAYVTLA